MRRKPKVGETIRIIPNHCRVVSNMVGGVYGVRNGAVEIVWSPRAAQSLSAARAPAPESTGRATAALAPDTACAGACRIRPLSAVSDH